MTTPGEPERALGDAVMHIAANYKTVGEMAYEVIKDAILSGRFAPGERLRQEALAEAIGVSRIPVRSALMQLEAEGLVSYHSRRGAVVRSLSVEQVREIYELRELLETHALRRAAGQIDADRATRLRELADRLDTQEEGAAFVDLRVEFYRDLYDAEHNPQLVKLIDELRAAVGRYMLRVRISHGKHASHRKLVDAVIKGDADAAVTWLHKHLGMVRKGVEEMAAAATPIAEGPKRRRRSLGGTSLAGLDAPEGEHPD